MTLQQAVIPWLEASVAKGPDQQKRLAARATRALVHDSANHTLTVRLHALTQAAHDQAIAQLCTTLNETQTVFPGTNLKLIFEIGSSTTKSVV